jgi:hypothetical protein
LPAFIDARLPVFFADADQAAAEDGVLLEGEGESVPGRDYFEVTEGHPVGCACCAPRNGAGVALSRLLLARARGKGPFFRRVVAVVRSEAGRDAVVHAIDTDPLASACFVLAGPKTDGLSREERGS